MHKCTFSSSGWKNLVTPRGDRRKLARVSANHHVRTRVNLSRPWPQDTPQRYVRLCILTRIDPRPTFTLQICYAIMLRGRCPKPHHTGCSKSNVVQFSPPGSIGCDQGRSNLGEHVFTVHTAHYTRVNITSVKGCPRDEVIIGVVLFLHTRDFIGKADKGRNEKREGGSH